MHSILFSLVFSEAFWRQRSRPSCPVAHILVIIRHNPNPLPDHVLPPLNLPIPGVRFLLISLIQHEYFPKASKSQVGQPQATMNWPIVNLAGSCTLHGHCNAGSKHTNLVLTFLRLFICIHIATFLGPNHPPNSLLWVLRSILDGESASLTPL
jgi:hypothetical protein